MRLHQIKRLFADLLLAKKYEMQKEEKERAKILSHIPWGVFRMHSHDKQLRPYFQKHKQLIYQWCSLSKCCCRGVKVFVISKLKLEAGEGGQGVSDDGYLHLHRHVNTLSALFTIPQYFHNTTILTSLQHCFLPISTARCLYRSNTASRHVDWHIGLVEKRRILTTLAQKIYFL